MTISNPFSVLFRVDSSSLIGTGHVQYVLDGDDDDDCARRCLTLSRLLKERGVVVSFVSRNLPNNITQSIVNEGFRLFLLPPLPDCASPSDTRYFSCCLHAKWLGQDALVDARQVMEAIVSNIIVIIMYRVVCLNVTMVQSLTCWLLIITVLKGHGNLP